MAQTGSDNGLWRWLVGGLIGGGVLLGLLVAAYAVGYNRGEHHATRGSAAPAAPAPATTSTTPPATTRPATTAATTPTASPAEALAHGKELYTADSCSGCHTLNGSASSGPTFAGLAGSQVTLTDGSTVTADDAYLAESITNPNAKIVKGYQPGIMSAAVAGFDLSTKPADVQALVAFINAQK